MKQSILDKTGDSFKSSYLERMVENLTTSYKLYWLIGVFEEAVAGNKRASMVKIAARMVACAWYPVVYYRLNLGTVDQLASCIDYIRQRFAIAPDADESTIINLVIHEDDDKLGKQINNLLNYVPYRLIRPFYQDNLSHLRSERGSLPDRVINAAIHDFNWSDTQGAPYQIEYDGSGIEIQQDWAAYFRENQQVVQGWLDTKLVAYLQARNPSVPAIPLKLHPPKKRNLAAAQKYWRAVIDDHQITDLYSGMVFDENNFHRFGPLSIDHFIPWSFVLHDEPWNLVPAFRNVNSSKGDRLPEIENLLKPFCLQQFDAFMTIKALGRHRKIIEAYLAVDSHALEYERTDASAQSFCNSVQDAILPLYQIARNQGFPVWRP